MNLQEIHQVVILGSGNVATHLAIALKQAEVEILQIFSRKLEHAKMLAVKIGSAFTDDIKQINPAADLYILCVSDDALANLIKNFPIKNSLIVHTSGTISINIFDLTQANGGVFYPLQTFSKNKEIGFKNIPICIEAKNKLSKLRLSNLAHKISNNVHLISSEERKSLHVAAVFASNFTNYFYQIANEILKEKNLSLDLLKPLIIESASKIINCNPTDAQTGPAKRGDDKIISSHLEFLNSHPEYQELYKLISAHIKQNFSQI